MSDSKGSSVAIIGMGLCTSVGSNCIQNWENVKKSNDFLSPQELFESPRYASKLCGEIKSFDEDFKNSKLSKCAKSLIVAAKEALASANLSDELKEECGIFLGTSIGGVFECEEALRKNIENSSEDFSALRNYECSSLSDMLAKKFSLKGMRMAFSTACSSSGLAIEAACNAIYDGKIKVALVCGVDALSRITVNGFASLMLLSNSKCKAFDKSRDGINLGEGAGVMILANEDFAKKSFAKIASCASSCDAHHATAPHPEGLGLAKSISDVLTFAGISSKEIDCVCAHGTGTEANDSTEFLAMQKIFADNIPPYFSLKGIFGHTLGASGIVNAIISVMALNEKIIPQSKGFCEASLPITKEPNRDLKNLDIKYVLSNSLGFGGNNSSILLSSSNAREIKKDNKKLCIYSSGVISPMGNSCFEFFENFSTSKNHKCITENILSTVSPLKKRRFARLQQMILDSSFQCFEKINNVNYDADNTCTVYATGLGMTSETSRFIENILVKKEAEAIPSAFINSVHNAPSALIANEKKLRGLNSAVTAKELSFESALWQAWAQCKYTNISSALISAGDETHPFIEKFKTKHAIYSQENLPVGEGAVSYFAMLENEEYSKSAVMKIHFIEFASKKNSAKENALWVLGKLKENGISDIDAWIIPSIANKFEEKIYREVFNLVNAKKSVNIENHVGQSYINSAYFPLVSQLLGKGKYAQFTISSTGCVALTVLEVL